tara:strand:- start:1205 stop:2296 length:1092 start_codon:yes stop_codon:yes gene_type:complete
VKKNTYAYISFLNDNSSRGGGHIETEAELVFFRKNFKNLDLIMAKPYKNKTFINTSKLNYSNTIYVKEFSKFIPIFGKRPFVSKEFFRKYQGVIIADSRCFLSFIIALFAGKKIIFKSHGSLAIYFFSYFLSNFSLFKWNPLGSTIKSLYYLILIIIFFVIEIFIYIFSDKIYMMRSKESFAISTFGKIYIKMFSNKTVFSFCPSLSEYNLNQINNIEKNEDLQECIFKVLIFGNWDLPHNFISLIDFIERLFCSRSCEINVVGKISNDNSKILKKLKLNSSKINLNILNYVEDLDILKTEATHVVSCSNYGSGIPIKCLEIVSDSFSYKYRPMISNYCAESLKGIIDFNYYVYPSKGSINLK